MHNNASAIPNLPTAQTWTSEVSWLMCAGLYSAMFQSLFQVRLPERQKRPLLELQKEVRQPVTREGRRRRQVHPVQAERMLAEFGRHQPVKVHQPHAQNE